MPNKLGGILRQQLYAYVGELLGRELTSEEHKKLKAIIQEYAAFKVGAWVNNQKFEKENINKNLKKIHMSVSKKQPLPISEEELELID